MLCVSCFVWQFFVSEKYICLNKLVHAFWLPVSSSHLISVPPNWQRHATKKVRSFIPCHFIIFGERSNPPRNLWVPDFRDLGSRPRTSRPRNLPRARIKNSQRPPQNTRDKGNLIFHSYSKTDVRAPCVVCSLVLDIHIMINWHLSKQGIRWPVSRDHIAGSS